MKLFIKSIDHRYFKDFHDASVPQINSLLAQALEQHDEFVLKEALELIKASAEDGGSEFWADNFNYWYESTLRNIIAENKFVNSQIRHLPIEFFVHLISQSPKLGN